jgi:phage-related protein
LKVTQVFTEKAPVLSQAFINLRDTVNLIWGAIGPVLSQLRLKFLNIFKEIRLAVGDSLGYMIEAFGGLTQFLKGVFSGNWDEAWKGLKRLVKNAINGILSLINGLLTGLTGGINAMVGMLNKLSFQIPSWVPGLGGKNFGLNLPKVKAVQIPLLAQGAVLPANKPFLAMVGDQKHGTNVEAPLATIQEAVAQVMGDMLPAMVAGFERTTDLQSRILGAVLGIQIGDETLATAVNRYNQKMEMVRGG